MGIPENLRSQEDNLKSKTETLVYRKITLEMLVSVNSCEAQLKIFAKNWPVGAEITVENALKAIELGIDLNTASFKLLSKEAFEAYYSYNRSAQKEYGNAIGGFWGKSLHRDSFTTPEEIEYWEKVVSPHWNVYMKARAQAFVAAFELAHLLRINHLVRCLITKSRRKFRNIPFQEYPLVLRPLRIRRPGHRMRGRMSCFLQGEYKYRGYFEWTKRFNLGQETEPWHKPKTKYRKVKQQRRLT